MQFALSYKQLRELGVLNIKDVADSSIIAILEKTLKDNNTEYIVKDNNSNAVYTINPCDNINYIIYEYDTQKQSASITKTKTPYRPSKIETSHHIYEFKLNIRDLSIKMYKNNLLCISSVAVREKGSIHILNTIVDEEDLYLSLSIFFAVSLMYADSHMNQ